MVGFFASRIWKKAPFVRLLVPVITGVLIQDIFAISKWLSVTVISSCLVMAIFSLTTSAFFIFRLPALSGFLLNLLLLGLGCQLLAVNQDHSLISRGMEKAKHTLILEIETPPERKGNRISCTALLRWEVKEGRCYLERERLLLNFNDTVPPAGWQPGSLRLIRTTLRPIRNIAQNRQKNGGRSFDYVAWCLRKHIHSSAFTNAQSGRLLSSPGSFMFPTKLIQMQERLRNICRRYVPAQQEGGLLEALLVGYTRDLDPDVLRSYSDAGVVHIIAISGLHLALIGELLQAFLLLFGAGRIQRLSRLLVLLTVIWGYSLLTGASPSVLRSAVMFSFVLLAKHFSLQAPVYNALAASAFLLICDDPFRLWDTGFQLSYAAVLSLVLFVRPVRQWLNPRNKLLLALWNAASVSIAAQVLTTPISIWYFHRFPFYFLLSNLIAVPLSSAILLGGMALLGLSWWAPAARLLGELLDAGLRLMNGFVEATNRLPGSAATAIPIHFFQVILCYSILYSGCRFAEKGNKNWFFAALLQACVFFVDGLNS